MIRIGSLARLLSVLALGLVATGGPAGAVPWTAGQDSYGYRFIDSEEPDGPTMDFEDISSTGAQAIASGIDDSAVSVSMGMNFSFYGTTYTSVNISSNGNVHFGSLNAGFGNTTLPTTAGPRPMIAPFWDDLVTGSGSVRYQLMASGDPRFIVQWTNVQHISDAGTVLTFQVKLYESGLVVVNYQSLSPSGLYSNGNNCTAGIQNAAGNVGLQYQANGTPIQNSLYSGLVIHYSLGEPPGQPSTLVQSAESAGDPEQPGFLCDETVYFRGSATDPDTGDRVRLEVEIIPAGQAFDPNDTTGVVVQGPLVSSGSTSEASYTFTGTPYGTSDYHWRARSVDTFGNRSDWVEFHPEPVHFRVDITPPSTVRLHSPPNDSSAGIHPPPSGPVGFEWERAIDAGPHGPIVYDIEIARDSAFRDLVAATTTADLFCHFDLEISPQPYHWRARATDQMDNVGQWSLPSRFYVVDDNGISKAGGDGIGPACSARADSGGSVAGLLAVMMIAALGMRRRSFKDLHHPRSGASLTQGAGPALQTRFRRALKRVLPLLLAAIAGAWWSPSAAAQQAGPGTWTARTAMPMSRYHHAAAGLDGSLYVFGGYAYSTLNAAQTSNIHSALRFDFLTNAWVTIAGITPRVTATNEVLLGWQAPCGAAFGGEIYQFGGYLMQTTQASPTIVTNIGPNDEVWRYSPAAGTWTQLADMPVALAGTRAAATDSKIFLTGGYSSSGAVSAVFEYDPESNTWASAPAMPSAIFSHYTGVDLLGRILVAGGQTTGTPLVTGTRVSTTWIYDPANPAAGWVARASMPAANSNGSYGVANGRLYCLGGSAFTTANYEFNPVRNAWATKPSLSAAHQYGAGGTVMGTNAAGNPWPRVHWTGGNVSTSYTLNHEYEPPDYGLPPDEPFGLFQRRVGGANLPEGAWMNGTTIELGAQITDPNVDQVRLEAEVLPASSAYTGVPNAVGAQGNEGTCTVQRSGLTEGPWKWRARARDWNDNVSEWVDFESPAHDFNVDRTPPTAPAAVTPQGTVIVREPHGGTIDFAWTVPSDNGPPEFTYEVQVSRSVDMTPLFSMKTGLTGTGTTFDLPPHRFPYYWRVRAVDYSGNVGPWSQIREFLVVYEDGINHAAGDATRVCGFGSPASIGPVGACLLMLVSGALATRRRTR